MFDDGVRVGVGSCVGRWVVWCVDDVALAAGMHTTTSTPIFMSGSSGNIMKASPEVKASKSRFFKK